MSPLLVSALLMVVLCSGALTVAAWGVWYERKFAGALQQRPGPTEVGPAGLLQPIADLLKLLQKEDILPQHADRALFNLAPWLSTTFTLSLLAVLPLSATAVVADLDVGLLFLLAIGSIAVIPVWMAGWASHNKYALLGGMRAVAQAVSYEVPLVLAASVPVILAGSMNLGEIVQAQAGGRWFALWPPGPGLVAFVLFLGCSLAEANRIPFDIPEAESELVAGVTTEYTGMKFGLLYLSEYLHTLVASMAGAVLFLGGWLGPGPDGPHWMILKTLLLFAFIFWVRWTWLRIRSDQLLDLCWRWWVPAGLVLVGLAGAWRVLVGGPA